jgi:hypothetical protein
MIITIQGYLVTSTHMVMHLVSQLHVVGLVVGNIGETGVGRDIIIEDRTTNLQQISECHRKFMSMQYPLLFPYGEDGFHDNITYHETQTSSSMRQKRQRW